MRCVSDRRVQGLVLRGIIVAVLGLPLPAWGAARGAKGAVEFYCDFARGPGACGFHEQSKARDRVTLVRPGRAGSLAVRLETQPGDTNVYGSGNNERTDLALSQAASDGYEGREHWWAQSVLFPSDYVNVPISLQTWNWGAIFGWHHTGSVGQGNLSLLAYPDTATARDRPTGLVFRICGGPSVIHDVMKCRLYPIGRHVKNVWYDFVYRVKWSSERDGRVDIWLRLDDEPVARRVVSYRGPTLYSGMGAYLKLANYHTPFGLPSAVIHSRVVRGRTPAAVALTPLQGMDDADRFSDSVIE